MAYASLLSLTQMIEQTLQSQSRHESQLALPEEQPLMRSLHRKLSNLLSFLETSSPKNTETISSLEGKIRDITFEAEDLIESHITKQIRSKRVRRVKRVTIQENYKQGLQVVLEKLNSISEEVDHVKEKNDRGGMQSSKFNAASVQIKDPLSGSILESDYAALHMDVVEETVKVHPRILSGASSSQSTFSDKSSMVGFENDMLRVKELLIGSSTKLETISIVGMGGIGKTTLATNVYNDSLVNHRFDIRAWITISQDYNILALLADLLRSMGELTGGINRKDEQELKLKLYQNLKQRRYLIVMDDVWDANVLEKFRNIFPDDNNGSRIIMTSRSSNVTRSDDSCSHIHRLNFLTLDQSWNLLRQKAFGKESCPRDLEDIGWRIAENCKGLALALVAVGGLLHKEEKTLAHWEYVAENMKSVETGSYDDLMEILSWSYKLQSTAASSQSMLPLYGSISRRFCCPCFPAYHVMGR